MQRRSRNIVIGIFAVIALGVFLPPSVNLKRYHDRIQDSIGRALGRRVTVGNVSPRLLPRPGLSLENFVVSDIDPFGAEPMLRSDEVTAELRLSSLWRGRLEIARLSLKYPSLNLVRAADGRWNIEALLERASQMPSAPTANPKPEGRPRFPYIEAETGRINLKLGQEKKVYALSDADFALWLASEDEWGVRLQARPVRTDASLNDTGALKLNGKFRRARDLRETPLELHLALERAQLGALTTLIYGRDRGWRGAVRGNVVLSGTPGDLKVAAEAILDDFRRYDIATNDSLRLQARCTGRYSTANQSVTDLSCESPAGPGRIAATGGISGLPGAREYDLRISAKNVPMQMLVAMARHAKKDLPDDLGASGDVDAAFSLRGKTWSGGGSTSPLQVTTAGLGTPLEVGKIEFALEHPDSAQGSVLRRRGRLLRLPDHSAEFGFAIRPFKLSLGAKEPAQARAWISGTRYVVSLSGDTDFQRLLQAGQMLGLRALPAAIAGPARIEMQVAGNWTGFAAPTTTGTVQLRNASAEVLGFAAPLRITTANLAVTQDVVRVQNIAATFPGARLSFTGWVQIPRGCAASPGCSVEFDLRTDQLATDDLVALFNPKKPWYKIIAAGASGPPLLKQLSASGRIGADRVAIKAVNANRVTAQARLADGVLELTDIRGELFGGKHRGQVRADFTKNEPAYAFSGAVDQVAMEKIAALMNDEWATGVVNATYRGTASGRTATDLMASATGALDFTWRDGVLRHLSLDGSTTPLRLRRFAGRLELGDGILTISQSKLESANGIYAVSGTASLGRKLGLRLVREGHIFRVDGTLDKPRIAVVSGPETQASLAK